VDEINRIKKTMIDKIVALGDAKDRLADAKAKELSAEAYCRLIHDLHTPIAALSQKAKIVNDPEFSSEVKQRSMKRMVELAEEILRQIESARNNLEIEATFLRDGDILKCVSNATEQVSLAKADQKDVKIL